MKIESLSLKDFRSYKSLDISFIDTFENIVCNGQIRDFMCFYGPNGIGKTTILEAITLLCTSFDYTDGAKNPLLIKVGQDRLREYLKKYIRNIDESTPGSSFRISGVFVHEGQKYEVVLTEQGFEKNEIIDKPFWWPGITLYTKFDTEMTLFQLREELWTAFKTAYEEVTGFTVEPEIENTGMGRYVIGFWMMKPDGKVHSRKASGGEKKLAKAFSNIVNMENERRPHIVLVDEIEGKIYYQRHLKMVEVVKSLFKGMQLISTTHSVPIIENYIPREELVNTEDVKEIVIEKENQNVQPSGDRCQESSPGVGEVSGVQEVRSSGLCVPSSDSQQQNTNAGMLPPIE